MHDSGCFIACAAMLLDISYNEALKLIHPEKDIDMCYRYDEVGLTPEESILRLTAFGLNPNPRPLRQLRNLRRTALLYIRWRIQPELMHAVVYDAARKKFLDPGTLYPHIDEYEEQLDSVYYFNVPELPHRLGVNHGSEQNAARNA